MIRVTTIFLCVLLAAAAFGRYRAEESVRKTHDEIERLELSKTQELQQIQTLRADIAYLENPERLARIARAKTDLRPSDLEQTISAKAFITAMTGEEVRDDEIVPMPADTITNAIAMVQMGDAQ